MNTVYTYTPLNDLPDDTIRLLKLLPGQPSENIKCHLSTAQLTSRPNFAALSYVWGSEPASEEIELNGNQFWVRKNLWQCLIRLRDPEIPLKIWIDAICVNQGDILERNQQVQFMNHIFGTARPVFSWLGEDVGANVASICPTFEQDMRLSKFPKLEEVKRRDLLYHWRLVMTAHNDDSMSSVCRAVNEVCGCQYWNRMWIVQEILVAEKLMLCLAGIRITWEDFRSSCNRLLAIRFNSYYLENEPHTRRFIEECNGNIIGEGMSKFLSRYDDNSTGRMSTITSDSTPQYLHELISKFGDKECCDLRDRVYALLGLRKRYRNVHNFSDHQPLQPDYHRSKADLFFDVIVSEGIPDGYFANFLRRALQLDTCELQQVCLSRLTETFSSNMTREATVELVMYSRPQNLSRDTYASCTQVLLLKHEVDLETLIGLYPTTNYMPTGYFLALAEGNRAIEAGDFVFGLQYSSVLFAFRYRRSYFRPIARIHNLMPYSRARVITKQRDYKSSVAHHGVRATQLKKVDARGIDLEVWDGRLALEYGPDTLLEVMRYTITE